MELEYKPKMTDDNGEPMFDGFLKIKIPPPKERMNFYKSMQFSHDANGKIEVAKDSLVGMTEKMMEVFEKNVIVTDLVHKKSGTNFKTIESMYPYSFYTQLASEVASYIAQGVQLGNP